MSVDYAGGLSHCDDLGDCGVDELFDDLDRVKQKTEQLAKWLIQYKGSCVVHVGAGLSTSAGIRDFRGKNGVWTEHLNRGSIKDRVDSNESDPVNVGDEDKSKQNFKLDNLSAPPVDDTKREKNEMIPFDETKPTISHMALKKLCHSEYVTQIISQNVDGLFLKSNLERKYICELHGDFYLDECTCCKSRYIRSTASKSMRLKKSTIRCPKFDEYLNDGKKCKGYLRDTILDWESPIPFNELRLATKFSKQCKLHICIGTSLQLSPSKDLVCNPMKCKTKKLVIINLQPTKFDQRADLVIHYYADHVMLELMTILDLDIPEYNPIEDPTKSINSSTVREPWLRQLKKK